MPNLIKIGQTVTEIWRFNGFQNGDRPPSWIFEIQTFLTMGAVKILLILHHQTKFRKKIGQTVPEISWFLWFSRWRPPPSWVFTNLIFYGWRAERGQYASSCQISSKSVKPLQRYGELTVLKMASVRHLGFVARDRDHPRNLLGGLYRYAKFGWNRCISFYNMTLSIFCPFCLKTPIHAPKMVFLGGGISPPKWGSIST